MALSSETSREDIDALAKQYGMYSSNRNTGTGTYVYRIAATKDIASVNTKAKGSFVSISFNSLQNNAVTEITYFDVDSMVGGFWYPEAGYSVVDYNVPQIVFSRSEDRTDHRSCMTPVDSANDVVTYVSTGHPDGNLLAQLFMSAHDGMTEEDIKGFISDNGLAYTSRGPGNEQTIAYSEDIVQKYSNDGSKITFDTDTNGLTRMIYYYYPSNYRQGYSAAFYSESYATSHSLQPGFQLVQPGAAPARVFSSFLLRKLCHITQPSARLPACSARSCCIKLCRILDNDIAMPSSALISMSMELNSFTISSCLALSGRGMMQFDKADLLISRNVLPEAYFSHHGLIKICV